MKPESLNLGSRSAAAERLVSAAVAVVKSGEQPLQQALDELAAPAYVTDADGVVTFFNRACIAFAGREPEPGRDRWCVTWKLFWEDGTPLPHAECPMALAIRERRPVRGLVAVAERPDGTRALFMPFPTPILGDSDELLGAVNLFLDIDGPREADRLRREADRCRALSRSIMDQPTILVLRNMAVEYDAQADRLEASAARLAQEPPGRG